jgi:hypothetical protein
MFLYRGLGIDRMTFRAVKISPEDVRALVNVSKSSILVTMALSLIECCGSNFAMPLEMDWVPGNL